MLKVKEIAQIIGIKQTTIEIKSVATDVLHLLDTNIEKLIVDSTDINPLIAIAICSSPKLYGTKLIPENNIWTDVFRLSVPKAKFKIDTCTEIHTINKITAIVNTAVILVTAISKRPFFVHLKMLSEPF